MAFIIIVSLYCAMVIVLAFGFARLEKPEIVKSPKIHTISVVVAVRNEAANLPNLLKDLEAIEYPHDKWDLIIVDDFSDRPLQLPNVIPSPSPGKKAAITAGVNASNNDIIVTTDADCRVPPQWLREINNAFQNANIRMVVGGVRIEEDATFFSKLQALEFVSVAATGAATLSLGFPTMCNGANLAYRKSAFIEVNGYAGNESISSGDDEFLMNKFNPSSITYLFSSDALATSSPHPIIQSFLSQRLRWAGKWQVNTSLFTKLFAVLIFLFQLSFIPLLIGALMGSKLFLALLVAKAFAESILLMPAANFFRVKWRWIPFLVLQLVYSPYVIVVGLLSQVVLPKWKGRAVETKV